MLNTSQPPQLEMPANSSDSRFPESVPSTEVFPIPSSETPENVIEIAPYLSRDDKAQSPTSEMKEVPIAAHTAENARFIGYWINYLRGEEAQKDLPKERGSRYAA